MVTIYETYYPFNLHVDSNNFYGCSQSSEIQHITTPDFTAYDNISREQIPIGVSDWSESGEPIGGFGLMGIYSIELDTCSLEGNLYSIRQSSLTDTLEFVDISNFLKLAPCLDCARLQGIALDLNGNIVATIGIKHPFDTGDPFKPISGRNRADLHVFNVEGIVITQSQSSSFFPNFNISIADSGLINPSGYTPYIDPHLDMIFPTDANVHPYIIHFDDYSVGNFDASYETGFESVTIPLPYGNLVMPMGSDYNYKDYIFSIKESESIEFLLAIGCTYAVSSANKNLRFTPEYRVPQHNKKAASEVRAAVTDNGLVPNDPLSSATLTVHVLDINHDVDTGNNLDQMFADSSVSNISIEVPGITAETQNDFTFISGNGRDPLDPLTFAVTVTNTSGGGLGIYTGIVKIQDSYSSGLNTSPLLDGKDGITRVDPLDNPLTGLFEITEFATYAVFEIEISSSNEPPVAVLEPNPAYVCAGSRKETVSEPILK